MEGTSALNSPVIARLDRAIQYSVTSAIESKRLGVLDAPPSRGMTAVVEGASALLLLLHRHRVVQDQPAAVRIDRLPRDVGRIVAGEERNNGGNLARLTAAAGWRA
jgi:hypothetical protein